MTITRLKFLGRIKIRQQDVTIIVSRSERSITFQVEANLASYSFPGHCHVFIDARQLLETIRFDLGSVSMPLPLKTLDISNLTGDRHSFDLVVVDKASGRKVGTADNLKPTIENSDAATRRSRSLLPVDSTKDLGGPYWRLDYCERDEEGSKDAPVLLIDRRATESGIELITDPALRISILPSAFREILLRILLSDQHEFDPSGADWRNAWVRLAAKASGENPPLYSADKESNPDYDDSVRAWIQSAVESFANKYNFLNHFVDSRGLS